MPYLATHPRRGFKPGDEVIHVGEGVSYRGRLGRVMSVHGSLTNGHIKVLWDHKMTAMEYSIGWARASLGVHIHNLRNDYDSFHGRKYVAKYLHHAFQRGHVIPGFQIMPHSTMKAQVDATVEAAVKTIDPLKELQKIWLGCLPPNMVPGHYRLEPHENGMGWRVINLDEPVPAKPKVEEPKATLGQAVTYPAFVENRANGTITRVSSEAMLQSLGEGTYTVYSKVGNISVKPVAQKEITFL